MNWFESFLMGFKATMETPTNYGWFHLMFVAFTITAIVLLCIFAKNIKDKTFRRLVFWCWIAMLVLEVYKQIFYAGLQVSDGHLVWNYQWGNFPFQLCSTPLYLLPFVAFMKDGKVRDSIMAFLSTFAFFGGLVVFVYPNDVFVSMIGINIQTMIHHGLQLVLGIYFMVYNRQKLNWKYFLKGSIVFGISMLTALMLNIIMYHALMVNIGQSFNMFYIGPYVKCHLPILTDIWTKVPYIAFLLIYGIGFVVAGALMFAIQYYLIKLINRQKNKKQPEEA